MRGLNLTHETREGILLHSKTRESVAAEAWGTATTLEGQIVKLADSIAYLNHDFQDAIRAGVLAEGDLPAEVTRDAGPGPLDAHRHAGARLRARLVGRASGEGEHRRASS